MSRYCTQCYEPGHNRRTCPELTQDHKDNWAHYRRLHQQYKDAGESHPYYEKRVKHFRDLIIERTGTDPETGAKVTKKTQKELSRKKIMCSYCRQNGHTRRVCVHLKEDMQVKRYALGMFRQQAQDTLNQAKINFGTLAVIEVRNFDHEMGQWKYSERVYMVTKFRWKDAAYSNRTKEQQFIGMELVGHRQDHSNRGYQVRWVSINALAYPQIGAGKVSHSSCGVQAPEYWLAALDHPNHETLKAASFPTGKMRCGSYSYDAFKNVDHPFYIARVALGLDLSTDY